MAIEISDALAALPETGWTVTALKAMDFMAPGAWSNPRDLTAMITAVTPARGDQVPLVKERADALFLSPDEPFMKAIELFRFVDAADKKRLMGSLRDRLPMLPAFVERFIPRASSSQELDAALKLIAEAITFALLRGSARDDPSAFIGALSARRYDVAGMVRMATWVAFEGVLPFGVGFMPRVTQAFTHANASELAANVLFRRLAALSPGSSAAAKRDYMVGVLETATPWVDTFVSSYGLTQEALSKQVMRWFSTVAGGQSVAWAADAFTDYFAHTGTQTVARAALVRAWIDLFGPEYSPMAPSDPSQEMRSIAVGRDPTPGVNHIILDAPTISGQHFEAIPNGEGWFIRDLNSTNGTFLVTKGSKHRVGADGCFVTATDTLLLGSHPFSAARLTSEVSALVSTQPVEHGAEPVEGDMGQGGSGDAQANALSSPDASPEAAPSLRPEDDAIAQEYVRREQAWLQIICLAAITDGTLKPDEKEYINRVAASFPLMLEESERWRARRLKRTLRSIRRRGFVAVIREALDALTEPDARLEALRLAALVTRADTQIDTQEARFLERLADALGLSSETLTEALEVADAETTQEIVVPPVSVGN